MAVSVLAWCRVLKNLAAWCLFAPDTHSLPPLSLSLSLFLSLSTLSACQAQLRGLEGNIPPLQSHLLWQYLAAPFIYMRTRINAFTHVCSHTHTSRQETSQTASLESWRRIGNRAKDGCQDDGLRWNEVSDVLAEDVYVRCGDRYRGVEDRGRGVTRHQQHHRPRVNTPIT